MCITLNSELFSNLKKDDHNQLYSARTVWQIVIGVFVCLLLEENYGDFLFLYFVLFIICHLGNQRIRRRRLQSAG